jgi:hypothetical protein
LFQRFLQINELISCNFTYRILFCRRIHSFTLFTDWRVRSMIKRFLLSRMYHAQTTILACEIIFPLTRLSNILCLSLLQQTFYICLNL